MTGTTPPIVSAWRRWQRHYIHLTAGDRAGGDSGQDTLLAALTAVETRMGERRGWDQKPRLWTLHLPDMDLPCLHLRVMPEHLWRGPGHPIDGLVNYAARLPDPRPGLPEAAFADSPDGFCGVAFMSEGYAVAPQDLTPQEMDRIHAGERLTLTHPARREIRTVAAADINGRIYHVQRFRGEQPTRRITTADRGYIPWALGRIAAHLRPA